MNQSAYLNALVTVTPENTLDQTVAKQHTKELYTGNVRGLDVLLKVFDNAEIETRKTVVSTDWFLQEHSWQERNEIYLESSVALLKEASERIIDESEFDYKDIDEILLVSTTGVSTPSLDARLMDMLPFRDDVRRLPVFGWGCAGGTQALAKAADIAAGTGRTVLVLIVELCTLCHQVSEASKLGIISSALFGDGAAAMIVSRKESDLKILASGEHRWPNTLDIMGWKVGSSGLSVMLARSLPDFIRKELKRAVDTFLDRKGFPFQSIDHIVPHPGGTKVIQAMQEIFSLSDRAVNPAKEILRHFGNMSAPTVLFVLEKMKSQFKQKDKVLMTSLGPGFTTSLLILENQ